MSNGCDEQSGIVNQLNNITLDTEDLRKEVRAVKDLVYNKVDGLKTWLITLIITVGLNFVGFLLGAIYFIIKFKS